MPQITIKPIILNDIDLIIGADNYEASVSRIELVPTTPTAKWKGMTPAALINLVGTPEWVCNIEGAQDHETTNSLSQYLMANVGQVKSIKLKPKKPATGTAPLYTIDAVILPGAIGGAIDSIPMLSVSLPVNGQPVRTVA